MNNDTSAITTTLNYEPWQNDITNEQNKWNKNKIIIYMISSR